ncbi:MAG: efflux RND transporter periplasmic adaptor subunit [Pseudomonadota bacterium]|uniref:efflux RND transporter periplasmic adaptor subunit n=1 Tax=Gallaecimonas pentaromativorans TaxID=584787 RepID=UPI00067F632F|nr:efflux RND transporter periplasmic adaptor subunit [Gallaecimonas pentaromativorans]MED5524271.1 efflux RND transporter periplasmic adaptor subunit [Pseudomonadota bacterium]
MKRVAIGCLLPLAVLVVAIAGFVGLMMTKKPPQKAEEARAPVMISVVTAKESPVHYQIESQGTVQPKTQTSLVAEVGGRVVSVSDQFRSGSMVQKGELLAQIDPADYQTALSAAEADLAQAIAAYEQEKAQGRVAAQEWRSVSPDKVTDIALRKPQLASAEALVQSQKARLEEAKRNLQRTEIRAPYDGLVRQRNIALGQYVTLGTQLGMIDDTAVAEVRLPVSDEELSWLGLSDGDRSGITISLANTVAGQTHHWDAELVQGSGVLDAQSRMSFVIAEVRDPYSRLKAGGHWLKYGTFVSAQMRSGKERPLIVLPKEAVRGDEVVLVDNDNHIRRLKVQVDRTDTENAYISSGLQDGDRVSLTSLSNVVDGTLVAIAPEPPKAEHQTQLAVSEK